MSGDARCIGVFDSGIGGLTVVRELRRRLPGENIVYFGDTARVPYGIKTSETVTRFARQNCEFLLRFDPKLIVVACNTASATALPELEAMLPVPVCGVVLPGAKEATLQSEGGTIAVIATEATIASDAYRRAIKQYDEHARVIQKPCPLLVPIAEEGRTCTDPIVLSVVRDYLDPIVRLDPKILVLGCTHYPLLRDAIAEVAGEGIRLVDSGEQTAKAVVERLRAGGKLSDRAEAGSLVSYVSDNPQRFRELGQRFLDHSVVDVTWVSPEQFYAQDFAQAR
ncbi:MAG: glutamate racemase [Planctomycetota bacterium]|nr:glutamate racemase [Planctomycetota bacterium]MCZ6697677.1 glutamate racemase [Planctomycetota bacterium]MCZ6815130.1 glutamate racemase [Planctomycetota bacterium]